jgi:hypothetical protein
VTGVEPDSILDDGPAHADADVVDILDLWLGEHTAAAEVIGQVFALESGPADVSARIQRKAIAALPGHDVGDEAAVLPLGRDAGRLESDLLRHDLIHLVPAQLAAAGREHHLDLRAVHVRGRVIRVDAMDAGPDHGLAAEIHDLIPALIVAGHRADLSMRAGLAASTVTPGSTPPVTSRTTPPMLPVDVWPKPAAGSKAINPTETPTIARVIGPPALMDEE